MGRRCKFRYILIACCVGILPFLAARYYSGIQSTGRDASVVSVRTGNDAGISMGIPKVSLPDNLSLFKQEIRSTTNVIREIIEQEEGFRSHPYLCSEGYVTIGYGTKLHNIRGMNPEDFPIVVSKDVAYELLKDKVGFLHSQLLIEKYRNVYLGLSSARRDIIISMAYQMGITGLYGFRNMWAALKVEAYDTAGSEMLDSRWARQTPERAYRHSRVMALDDLSEYK